MPPLKPIAEPSILLAELKSPSRVIEVATQGRAKNLSDLASDMDALQQAASFVLVVTALDGAINRYEASIGNDTWMAARAAVGEALWWIASADEYLRFGSSFGDHVSKMGRTEAGRLVGGLVLARNRAGHQLATLLVYSTEVVYSKPNSGGSMPPGLVAVELAGSPWATAGALNFCTLASLPSAAERHVEKFGRDEWYDQEVGGRDVAAVLRVAATSLRLSLPLELTDGTDHSS
jgi:hypothetical protein